MSGFYHVNTSYQQKRALTPLSYENIGKQNVNLTLGSQLKQKSKNDILPVYFLNKSKNKVAPRTTWRFTPTGNDSASNDRVRIDVARKGVKALYCEQLNT